MIFDLMARTLPLLKLVPLGDFDAVRTMWGPEPCLASWALPEGCRKPLPHDHKSPDARVVLYASRATLGLMRIHSGRLPGEDWLNLKAVHAAQCAATESVTP